MAKEVVETMTIGGAKALRLEDEIGSFEVGKQADLVILSLKNIAQQPVHDIYAAVLFASNGREAGTFPGKHCSSARTFIFPKMGIELSHSRKPIGTDGSFVASDLSSNN